MNSNELQALTAEGLKARLSDLAWEAGGVAAQLKDLLPQGDWEGTLTRMAHHAYTVRRLERNSDD